MVVFIISLARRLGVSIIYLHNEGLGLSCNVVEIRTLPFKVLHGPQSNNKRTNKSTLHNIFGEMAFYEDQHEREDFT